MKFTMLELQSGDNSYLRQLRLKYLLGDDILTYDDEDGAPQVSVFITFEHHSDLWMPRGHPLAQPQNKVGDALQGLES